MKYKLLNVALAALLIPAANFASAEVKPAAMNISGNMVKIGVLTDMSGVYSYKPKFAIEMVYADHQNKADVGSNKVREWYDTEGVDMVTDLLNSGVSLAVGKVTQEKKRIAIFVGSGSTRLTDQDCTPNTVHYAYDTYALANVAGKAIVKIPGTSLRPTMPSAMLWSATRKPSSSPTAARFSAQCDTRSMRRISRPTCCKRRRRRPRSSVWPMPAAIPSIRSRQPANSVSPRISNSPDS